MIFLFISCTTAKEDNKTVQNNDYLYEFEDNRQAPALIDLETILVESIAIVQTIDVEPVITLYELFLSQTTATCPQWFTNTNGPYWSDNCTSNSGVNFQGVGLTDNFTDIIDENGNTLSGTTIYCEGSITGLDGSQLNCSGTVQRTNGITPDGTEFISTYIDPYSIVQNGVEQQYPKHQQYLMSTDDFAYRHYNSVLLLEDGIVAFEGNGIPSIGECTLEPNGVQSIQLHSSDHDEWVFLQWHGPVDGELFDIEHCDGCADVYFIGSYLGQVCADFSSWND
jgi:hypothetical protein